MKSRLILSFLIVIVTTTAVLSLASFFFSSNLLKKNIYDQINSTLQIKQSLLIDHLSKIKKIGDMATRSKNLQGFCASEFNINSGNAEETWNELYRIQESHWGIRVSPSDFGNL